MIPLAEAAPPAGGGAAAATLITGIVLALAAIISSLTPIVLARRKARREAEVSAAKLEAKSSDLTLASWTALNAALQEEIRRLQGVQDRQQNRIQELESEIEQLRRLVIDLQKGNGGVPHA